MYDRAQRGTPVKLSTALLNQLNPNLSSEQKLTRTINQVEKWLERDAQINISKIKNIEPQTTESKSELFSPIIKRKHDIKTNTKIDNLLLDQLKITENISEVNLKSIKNHNLNINKLHTDETLASLGGNNTNLKNNNNHNKHSVFEYSSVPIKAHSLECENLLQSDDETPNNNSNASSTQSQSTIHRYVHIHHHYHHFENET